MAMSDSAVATPSSPSTFRSRRREIAVVSAWSCKKSAACTTFGLVITPVFDCSLQHMLTFSTCSHSDTPFVDCLNVALKNTVQPGGRAVCLSYPCWLSSNASRTCIRSSMVAGRMFMFPNDY